MLRLPGNECFLSIILLAGASAVPRFVEAHDGHSAATYEVTESSDVISATKHVELTITDAESNQLTAARFSLTVDGRPYVPQSVNRHGLRFTSIHQRRKQQIVVTYARGTGPVLIEVPEDAKAAVITAAKGFEYLPATATVNLLQPKTKVRLVMQRWCDLQRQGWHAADEHLHYERTDPRHDLDWLTMLDADGLSHAHFLVLKGGNLPGIWADQYAHGSDGEANDGRRLIRSGQEYRDSVQGHINLLGLDEVIPPISTGGIGAPAVPYNYPPLLDVHRRAHKLGGIGGPAHGASLAKSSTAALDTVLGGVDFFEIANTHLYKTDVWYHLLNCGFIVPPVAGTDLPNFGFRDPWQPLLGEIRTYVRSENGASYFKWMQAVKHGATFITSGPIIKLRVNGTGPGGVVHLPAGGGQITIEAELASPRKLKSFEIVQMGNVIGCDIDSSVDSMVQRMTIQKQVEITESCWLAARGTGGPKKAVEAGLRIKQNEIAHTGVVQVLVGNRPIRDEAAVEKLRQQLRQQQEYYRTEARYEKPEHRIRFVGLFDKAIERLAPLPTSLDGF